MPSFEVRWQRSERALTFTGLCLLGLLAVGCSPAADNGGSAGGSGGSGVSPARTGGSSGSSTGGSGSSGGSGGSGGSSSAGVGGSSSAGGSGGASTTGGSSGGSGGVGGSAAGSGGAGGSTGGSGGSTGGSGGATGGSGGSGGGSADGGRSDGKAGDAPGGGTPNPNNPCFTANIGNDRSLPGLSAADFCDGYEKYCKYTPDGSLMSKCGPGQPVGPLYKDRADCMTKYMAASAGARACRAGQMCRNGKDGLAMGDTPRGASLIVNACSHATGYCAGACK